MRRALPGGLEHAFLHHSGLEKSFDQTEKVAIGNLGGETRHDDLVRKVVKEPRDIGIEHMRVPLPMEFQDPLDGQVAVTLGPETIGVVVEDPLEERTQEEPQHLLSNTVAHRGDAEWTGLAVSLGDMDTA